MNNILFLILILTMISVYHGKGVADKEVNILVITGGHKFDQTSFFDIVNSFDNIRYDTASQPRANAMYDDPVMEEYDALVFYDMSEEVQPDEKSAFLKLLSQGKGMVFLHHSLVSYQEWDDFSKIIGGKYVRDTKTKAKKSGYKHDITLDIEVIDDTHPVTYGMSDFSIYDEGYYNIHTEPDIQPLLATDHEKCAEYVAWTNEYASSGIVYIMLGYVPGAHKDPNYRQLIENAIQWVK